MQMTVRKTQKLVSIIPVSCNGSMSFKDIHGGDIYSWDDLEPVKLGNVVNVRPTAYPDEIRVAAADMLVDVQINTRILTKKI